MGGPGSGGKGGRKKGSTKEDNKKQYGNRYAIDVVEIIKSRKNSATFIEDLVRDWQRRSKKFKKGSQTKPDF